MPGYLPALVHVLGLTVGTTQGAQIGHRTVLPKKGMLLGRHRKDKTNRQTPPERVGGRIQCTSYYLAEVVDIAREASISAQRSNVDDLVIPPKDTVNFRKASQWIDNAVFRHSDDFSAVI